MREHRRPRARKLLDERADDRRQGNLTEIAQRKARDGDAHLHAGNDAAKVADELLDDFRARVALLDKLANARKPDRNQRKFGRREKSVHADQENDAEDVERAHRRKALTAQEFAVQGNSNKRDSATGEIRGRRCSCS